MIVWFCVLIVFSIIKRADREMSSISQLYGSTVSSLLTFPSLGWECCPSPRKGSVMNKLVLVIDDSLTVCRIIEVWLRREGYESRCFPDGVLALQWLKSQEACVPGLVLVDLCLPKLDGYSVIQHLRAQPILSQSIFVIITRRDGLIDKLKGKLVGARAYLTKPLQVAELVSVVQECLGVVV
jgi:twitching motility two-component system response regulator PilG